MSMRWPALICVLLLLGGCHAPPLQEIDQTVSNLASHPWDVAPTHTREPVDAAPAASGAAPAAATSTPDSQQTLPPVFETQPAAAARAAPSAAAPGPRLSSSRPRRDNVVRTSFTQPESAALDQVKQSLQKFELNIPKVVPGSETPLVTLPPDRDPLRPAAIARLFPQLPALPEEPRELPGADGRPYSLADLQKLAVENSPALRQAISDIEAARGVLKQSVTYPNPTIGFETNPNNNNTGSATMGFFVDQVVKTGGKLTIAGAANLMNLRTAELALKRARSDLATTIRGDYYTLLVAKETVRVNKALAQFTDEIFRLQADLLAGGFAASHEPAALRSQAFLVRLGYQQAIANYVMAWKELVADLGLKQLPLSQVEGQVDRLIPYYDYDQVLAHVLHNHTDILTALLNIKGSDYTLKLAQVTPIPDVEVRADLFKEHMIQPFQNYFMVSLSIPFPVWDQNKGAIRAAAAAKVRAIEGPHAAQVNLTTNLATAYATYQTNLYSMDYYRRNILPDQVRYYRGVFQRRRVDPGVAFGDLVQAQQTLVADVTAYLGILNSLWTSVVSVADFLQTDDLFQLAKPVELPSNPIIDALHEWPCPHPELTAAPDAVPAPPAIVPHAAATTPSRAIDAPAPGQGIARPNPTVAAASSNRATGPGGPAAQPVRGPVVSERPFAAAISGNASRPDDAKPPGVLESPFAGPTSMASPPVVQAPRPFATELLRPSSTVSLGSSP
jgi:cobalt-zinc-cadmium efflux system outer membrane protein